MFSRFQLWRAWIASNTGFYLCAFLVEQNPIKQLVLKKNGSAVSDLMYILNVKILAAEIIDWKKNSPEITHNS